MTALRRMIQIGMISMKSKHLIKIVMMDPATTSDPTGIVGILGNCKTGKVQVRLAKQFKSKNEKERFESTLSFLRQINSNVRPDLMGMELNNVGKKIIVKLKKRGLYMYGMTTSSNLKEETRREGKTMDKNYMKDWLAEEFKKHNIKFPRNDTGDMTELINQIPQMVGSRTPGGKFTYKAQRGRHDDLFMALLLCLCVFLTYMTKWREIHG